MEKVEAKKLCKEHMHRYVCVQMHDGAHYDGIMENVDDDMIYLAVPVGHDAMVNHGNGGPNMMPAPYPAHARGFFPGYGYGYGYGYPYPYYGYGRRRFNRLVLPLIGLTALTLLPYY